MKKIILIISSYLFLSIVFSACAQKSACPAYNKDGVHNPFDENGNVLGKKKKKEKKNGLVNKKQPKRINKR